MPGSLVTTPGPAPTPVLVRLLALAAGALMLAGCGRTSITEPLAATIAESEGITSGELDEIEFWHTLPARTVVANGDALLGLIFLATGGSPDDIPVTDLVGADYAQRVEYAKQRGWLNTDFQEPPDLAVRRGIIARALTDICRIKGGVMMQLLGPTERYSARELEYLGVMPPGSTNQVVAGGEFVGLISQAQDYINYKQFEPLPGVKETLSGAAPAAPARPAPTEPATPVIRDEPAHPESPNDAPGEPSYEPAPRPDPDSAKPPEQR